MDVTDTRAPHGERTQEERNKELFRRFIDEGFGTGDLAAVDAFFPADVTPPQAGVQPPSRAGVKGLIALLHTAFPQLTVTIEDIAADGDKVWARLRGQGTHRGEFMGLPPTGKAVAVDIIDICRFEGGKIVEHWGLTDRFGLMTQVGMLPRSPQTAT